MKLAQTDFDMASNPGLFRFLFSPSGRFSRKSYTRGLIFWVLPAIAVFVQISVAETRDSREWLMFAVLCFVVVTIANLVSGVMVTIKRLHDIGHSGLNVLFVFVPFVGIIAFLYFLFAPSGPPNRFDDETSSPQ